MFRSRFEGSDTLDNVRVDLDDSGSIQNRRPYIEDGSNYWEINIVMGSLNGE